MAAMQSISASADPPTTLYNPTKAGPHTTLNAASGQTGGTQGKRGAGEKVAARTAANPRFL